MINIKVTDKSIEAKGHASALICNSVSVLMWALATSLVKAEAQNVAVLDSDGYQFIEYTPNGHDRAIFDGIAESLKQMGEQFPEEICYQVGEHNESPV